MPAFKDLRGLQNIATDRGSELGIYAEVTATSPAYTLGSVFSLPYYNNSSLANEAAPTDVLLEGTGKVVKYGTETKTFNMTFIQQDADSTEFYTLTLKDKRILLVKKVREMAINGNHQWLVMPIVEADPSYNIPSTGFEIEKTFNVVNNTAAITINLTTLNTAGGWSPAITCASFTVPANQGFAYYTQAV